MLNQETESLGGYPTETIRIIKKDLSARGVPIFDFGVGDPRLPTWEPIRNAISESVPEVSQYPSIFAEEKLEEEISKYLMRRFDLSLANSNLSILPTRGSKEGIFHIALSLIGRAGGKKTILYPTPGYPVYSASAVFARGRAQPFPLTPANDYLVQPWTLSSEEQKDIAAVWINYPHNPSSKVCSRDYLQNLIDWAEKNDSIILSDECYVDIFFETEKKKAEPPLCALSFNNERVISFFSLSKRSGITGYRSGFICGPKAVMESHAKARSRMGLAMPTMIQSASAVAWADDEHVRERRLIFSERLEVAFQALKDLDFEVTFPEATFYLWVKVPSNLSDVEFVEKLARSGVITMPSTWLGGDGQHFRLSMVPSIEETKEAMKVLAANL